MLYWKKENVFLAGGVALLAVVLSVSGSCGSLFLLNPGRPGLGFIYECFTCHLVHWTGEHLIYDLLCFLLLAFLLDARRVGALMLFSAFLVSCTVCACHPELVSYCGLSGVNCALFTGFALELRQEHRLAGDAAITGLLLKTALEMWNGHTYFAQCGFIPVHEAHLAGMASGLLFHCICGVWEKRRTALSVVQP